MHVTADTAGTCHFLRHTTGTYKCHFCTSTSGTCYIYLCHRLCSSPVISFTDADCFINICILSDRLLARPSVLPSVRPVRPVHLSFPSVRSSVRPPVRPSVRPVRPSRPPAHPSVRQSVRPSVNATFRPWHRNTIDSRPSLQMT